MGYIFLGFILVLVVETLIRIFQKYEPQERHEPNKTQVSLPWYGWGLAGLLTLGIWRKRHK